MARDQVVVNQAILQISLKDRRSDCGGVVRFERVEQDRRSWEYVQMFHVFVAALPILLDIQLDQSASSLVEGAGKMREFLHRKFQLNTNGITAFNIL